MSDSAPPAAAPSPGPAASERALGIAARRRGDQVTALAHFRVAAENAPDDPVLRNEIGAAALAIGALDEAEENYRLALAHRPGFVDALRGLGHCARRRGDHHQALLHFEAALACCGDPRPRFEAAAERVALGADAEAAHAPLLEASATRARACLAIGRARQRKGDLAGARAWLRQAIEADPADRAGRLELAALETQAWDLGAAETLYDGLLAMAPDDVDALLGRGALARRQGRREAARAAFEAAFRRDPGRGAIEWAREERDAGAFEASRAILQARREAQPDDAAVLVQLGLTARLAGDGEAAVRHFEEALRADPRHLSAHVEMAADLHRLGRTREATVVLAGALTLWPEHPRVLEAEGDLALAGEDLDRAADLFGRARRAPGQLSALAKLARALAVLGRPDEALFVLTEAACASPDLAIARAQILKEAGRLDEAAAAYREGLDAFPSNFALWLQASLFRIDWGRGDALAGIAEAGPAATPAERVKVNLVRGATAAAGWRFAEAKSFCEAALDAAARDGATHVRIVQAALATLDLATADRHLAALASLEAPTRRLRGQTVGPFQSLLGQIVEEARLDIEGLGHLIVAGSLPGEARLDALLAVARAFPEMTLGAMQVTIALRQAGWLDRVAPAAAVPGSAIPRGIVQFWHEETLPNDIANYCRSWAAHNPDHTCRRLSEREAAAFIAAECDADVARVFRRAREPAIKADLFRLAYLACRGGVYADVDDRCLGPLDGLALGDARLVLYQEDIGSIGNNLMMAAPRHPLLHQALACAADAVLRGDCDIPWLSTGPGLLTRLVAGVAARGGADALREQGILILGRRDLLDVAATGCTAAYKGTRRHWSRAAFTISDGSRPTARAARPSFADSRHKESA